MLVDDACAQVIQRVRHIAVQSPHQHHATQAALHTTAAATQEAVLEQAKPTPEPIPKVAKILGFAGAIPFLALTPQVVHGIPLLPDAWVANAGLLQVTYGVSIASFLGGIHWAMAMAEYGGMTTGHDLSTILTNTPAGPALSRVIANDRYLWSVSPCLLAWPAVVMPPGPAALVVGSTLLGCYLVDRKWAAMDALPRWYMSLRAPLTAAAVTGMALTVWASGFNSEVGVAQ